MRQNNILTVQMRDLEFGPGVMNASVGVPFPTVDDFSAPVPPGQWRGSIVSEIIDDGACKVEDGSTEEQSSSWSDNTVWATESMMKILLVAPFRELGYLEKL